MNYLVDTNVLSEPHQKRPEGKVVQWLRDNESKLYTSALVTGEIRYGIELLPANSAKRAALMSWYERLLEIMTGRVLSVNVRVAEEWSRLHAQPHAKTRNVPTVDGLLAATAHRYQLTIATDNVKDFNATGIKIFNPFD